MKWPKEQWPHLFSNTLFRGWEFRLTIKITFQRNKNMYMYIYRYRHNLDLLVVYVLISRTNL